MKAALRHGLEIIAVLAGVIAVSFLVLQWLPGDPAELYAGEGASEEDVALLRRRMGLDQPVWVQLARHAARLARGDLGISLRSGRPVRDEIAARLPTTLRVGAGAIAIALAFAVPAALAASFRPAGLVARAIDWLSLAILALPVYWLGLALILIFSVKLRWTTPLGAERWPQLLLPALALGAHTGAATARLLSRSLSDTLGAAYVQTALAKGLSARRALVRHALPNALIPAVTFFFMEAGRLLGGAVLTETVFAVNGIGRYLIASIGFRDYPAVVGVAFFIAVCVAATNAAADIACRALDPRWRERR